MHIEIKFIWFDMWIGLYIDLSNKRLYICPLPMVVIIFHWNKGPCYLYIHGEEAKWRRPNLDWLLDVYYKLKTVIKL